jgi:proteasome accessory factor C
MSADLTTLWMCGLPGYTALELMDLSFESGYVTIRNAQTLQAPRTLTLDEIVALLMGLDLLKGSLEVGTALHDAIKSLEVRLSDKTGITSKLRATSEVSSKMRADIESALSSQKSLKITYHSLYNDSLSERLVSPLELKNENGVEYLSAFCHNAQSFRVFRLDRILECAVKDANRTPKLSGESSHPTEISFSIIVNSRLRLMKERFSLVADSASKEHHSNSFSEQWIIRSVFASSASAELVNPAALREQIAQKAHLLLDRYLAV